MIVIRLFLILIVLAMSCGSVPTRYYYTLSYPLEREEALKPPIHPIRLRIKPFRIGIPYDRLQIVYRQSPFEFQYYGYHLWASKPQHMLREIFASHIESLGLVVEVTTEYGEHLPDYELSGDIEAIEEYDSGDVWYGHLAMRIELTRFSDRVCLWRYSFDKTKKVFKKEPVQVVRVISSILEEEMNKIMVELDRILSKERGVTPTIAQPPEHLRERESMTPQENEASKGKTPPDLIVPDEGMSQ